MTGVRAAGLGLLDGLRLPRADEVPSFEMDENPVPTKTNPLGVKGAGEAGNVGALAAIMNAVVDALSPLGITHLDLPATPESVWRAIGNIPIVKPVLEARAGYRNADKP